MQGVFYRTLEDYMVCNNIKIVDKIPFDKNSIDKIDEKYVEKQIYALGEFHKVMKKCDEYVLERINNETGKLVENFKMDLNKVKLLIEKVSIEGYKNTFEKLLIKEGKGVLELGEKCVDNIYSNGYINSIVRSMDEGEICIGNSYFNNLVLKNKQLVVKDINRINYNIIEMDIVYLLNKLKRKGIKLNWERLICFSCCFEHLEKNSQEIIRWFMNYPYDFVKYCLRYKKGKKKWDSKKYEDKLVESIINSSNII